MASKNAIHANQRKYSGFSVYFIKLDSGEIKPKTPPKKQQASRKINQKDVSNTLLFFSVSSAENLKKAVSKPKLSTTLMYAIQAYKLVNIAKSSGRI